LESFAKALVSFRIFDEWEYSIENQQAFIIAISIDCLAIAFSLPTTNVLTVGTILVVDGYLDKLCPNSGQE